MKTKKLKAFTLLEMIIVLIIISILIAVAIPSLNKYTKSAQERADKMNIRAIEEAAYLYCVDNNWADAKTKGLTVDTLINEGYLDNKNDIKTSPITGLEYSITVDRQNRKITVNNGATSSGTTTGKREFDLLFS